MIRLAVMACLLAGPVLAQEVAVPPEGALLSIAATYGTALVALAAWAVLMPVLAIVAVATPYGERAPSGYPARNYDDRGYRAHRAQQNAIEASGPFVAACAAAILAGAAPFWVNLLAALFIVARIATAAVHIGTVNQPARSATWTVGIACTLALAIMAAWSALAA